MKKVVSVLITASLVASMLIGLSGCANKKEQTTFDSTTVSTSDTQEQQVQTTTPEPTTTPAENTTATNYYEQLLENDTQAKQDAENKRASDLELADIMLRECTKKLSNCTVELYATTKYKCGDVDKQIAFAGGVPTTGEYVVGTRLCFTENGTQLATRQEKNLYRDQNLINNSALSLTAQVTTSDKWSDKMDFLMYLTLGSDGSDVVLNKDKDSLSKGEVYQYISKDVRSSLSRFLSIDVDDITEKDGTYIITGKTKDIFVIVDEVGGNSILNNQTWVNGQGQKNAGLMNTTGILVKHKVDVTLYIDKATETLTAIEAKSENALNEEETLMAGVVLNVGSTEIELFDEPDALITRSISDVDKINKAITYSR